MTHRRRALAALFLAAAVPSSAFDNIAVTQSLVLKKKVKDPVALALDDKGRLLIADGGTDSVQIFSGDGPTAAALGGAGKTPGKLSSPAGVAVGRNGRVYVAEPGNHRVSVFAADGKFLRSIGEKGAGKGQLQKPAAVAAASDGHLFVADTGNNRVAVFTEDGMPLHSFGAAGEADGQMKDPAALGLGPDGAVYVLDEGNARVQKFSAQGQFIAVLGKSKSSAIAKPSALAVDDWGYVYVADAQTLKVHEFDPAGKPSGVFGAKGAERGQFKRITALASAPGGGAAVLDASVGRVQVFTPEGDRPAAAPEPMPFGRLRVKEGPSIAFMAEDLIFADTRLAALAPKNKGVFFLDKGAPRALTASLKKKPIPQKPVALASDGARLYVVEEGRDQISLWDSEGKLLQDSAIGAAKKGDGRLKNPRAAAVDGQGRIYVLDAGAGRCQVFSKDGVALAPFGAKGTGAGQMSEPVAMAALSDTVAILDAGRKAVLLFNTKGKLLAEYKDLSGPVDLAADPSRPFFYVLEAEPAQVKILDAAGKWVGSFGAAKTFAQPKAVAADDDGALWVADGTQVKSFDLSILPKAPSDMKAAPGEGEVALSWEADPENLALTYKLFRSTGNAVTAPFAVVPGTTTAYADRDVVPGLTYTYAVVPVGAPVKGAADSLGPRASASAVTKRPANLPPLELTEIKLDDVFSAQYKYYTNNPVGTVELKNNTEKTFQKLRLGFIISDFMDYPTETVVARLDPGARESWNLKAVFNNKILTVSEDTPIQAKLTITYYEDGVEKVLERTQPFTLYGRNALSWDDPRRLATFITPKDPPLIGYARGALGPMQKSVDESPVARTIAEAHVLFEALGTTGLAYRKDPNSPYDKVSEKAKSVDYVQFPRETLARKSGDCDDLTALLATLLEGIGAPVQLVDVPGHILLMFEVEEPADTALGFPEDWFVNLEGSRWVPLETTWVGKPFLEAWREGMRRYRLAEENNKLRLFDVHDAWTANASATLPEGPEIPAPAADALAPGAVKNLAALEDERFKALTAPLLERVKAAPTDDKALLALGLACAEHKKWDDSAAWFEKAAAADAKNAAAPNNLGNVHFSRGAYDKAVASYEAAAKLDAADGGTWLNLARAQWALGQNAGAEKSFEKAGTLWPRLKGEYKTAADAFGAARHSPAPVEADGPVGVKP